MPELKEWVPGFWKEYELRHHNGTEIKCYGICSACRYGGNGAGCDEGDDMTIRTKPTYWQKKYGRPIEADLKELIESCYE